MRAFDLLYNRPANLALVEKDDRDDKDVRRLFHKAKGLNPFVLHTGKPVTVVLVEDDDGDAMAVERAFQRAKIANPIVRAVDGLEALDMLKGANGKEKVESPYLMLVDIAMPRMGGLKLIAKLRTDKQLRHSIAFILTTSGREEDIEAAYDLNVAGYIVKAAAGEDFLNLARLVDCYERIVELR